MLPIIMLMKFLCQVSEGLDFADHAGRAVVITGLPFATRNDPKVIISPILPSEYFFYVYIIKVLAA